MLLAVSAPSLCSISCVEINNSIGGLPMGRGEQRQEEVEVGAMVVFGKGVLFYS